jgi:hypothetical protein
MLKGDEAHEGSEDLTRNAARTQAAAMAAAPMTIAEFKTSLSSSQPPAGLRAALMALWHDGRGDWDAAHRTAQDIDDGEGAWIHAYLHRKEGDAGNAAYWYRRAGKPVASTSLEAEWAAITSALLASEAQP